MRSISVFSLLTTLTLVLASCSSAPEPAAPAPAPAPALALAPAPAPVEESAPVMEQAPVPSGPTVDQLESQIAGLRIQLLERAAQITDTRQQLDQTRQEVVRAMAKLQSQASRAEAASGIAEAEVAVEALGRTQAGQELPEFSQAGALLAESTIQFDDNNFGGSLYLATQARGLARGAESRLPTGGGDSLLAGETIFAIAVPLHTTSRSNVREGPGLGFAILFTLSPSAPVTGQSYTGEWVRVVDNERREGWIFHSLVSPR